MIKLGICGTIERAKLIIEALKTIEGVEFIYAPTDKYQDINHIDIAQAVNRVDDCIMQAELIIFDASRYQKEEVIRALKQAKKVCIAHPELYSQEDVETFYNIAGEAGVSFLLCDEGLYLQEAFTGVKPSISQPRYIAMNHINGSLSSEDPVKAYHKLLYSNLCLLRTISGNAINRICAHAINLDDTGKIVMDCTLELDNGLVVHILAGNTEQEALHEIVLYQKDAIIRVDFTGHMACRYVDGGITRFATKQLHGDRIIPVYKAFVQEEVRGEDVWSRREENNYESFIWFYRILRNSDAMS